MVCIPPSPPPQPHCTLPLLASLSNVHLLCLGHSFLFHHTLSSRTKISLRPPLSKAHISPFISLSRRQKKKSLSTHTHSGTMSQYYHPSQNPLPSYAPRSIPTTLYSLQSPTATLILITPPPPSSALISLHQICSDSKQFPLICDFSARPPPAPPSTHLPPSVNPRRRHNIPSLPARRKPHPKCTTRAHTHACTP